MNISTAIKYRNPPPIIDLVKIPGVPGRLGLTSCPGRSDDAMLDLYEDSLGDDLHAIKAWGAAVLITLLDEPEFRMLGVQSLGEKVINMNMIWLHLPLRNMGSPDREFLERWRAIVPGLCKMLRGGQNIVMHCREGVGRTGLAAACLLIELGLPAREAIRAVRNARPGSLQHLLHEQFCYAYQPLKTPGSNP